MAGAWTTKTIKDGAAADIVMRMWDESGTGAGPFSFGQMVSDGLGAGVSPATAALQTSANTKLDTLATKLDTNHTDEAALHTDVGTTLHADLVQLHADCTAPTPAGTNPIGTVGGSQAVTTTAVIANAASLSGAVDCSAGRLARISMSAAWTAANLTFQISPDNATFQDLYDDLGNEYTVVAVAAHEVRINLADFLGARYIKIRSGTGGTPVTQGASRTLTLTLVP